MGLTEKWTQAQEAVVGSMLLDERCVGLVLSRTAPENFPDSRMRHLYEAIRALWGERRPVDPVTVLHASDPAYQGLIAGLLDRTPTANNVSAYLDVLDDCTRLHAYQTAAGELLACRTADEAGAIWERMGRELMGAQRVRCVTLEDAIGAYLDRMNETTPPDYLSFGIKQLDNLLRLRRGKFVVLAADSSTGKTALALQFAYHIAESGKKVGFFSLETDSETLTDRLMAETQVAGINLPRTQLHALTRTDYARAIAAGDRAQNVPLCLIDSCETVDEIRTWTVQQGFEVIFIDYIQLIAGRGEKRWDVVTETSMQLHRMAQKLGVTIVGLSQVTPPDKTGNRPLTMDDLRESRQLKHDADVIMILERTDEFPNGRTLTLAKNKDGKRNRGMKLQFDAEHMTFSYFRRVQPSNADQVQLHELDDDEEVPF